MKLDSLEIPRTFPKVINTDRPEPGDVIITNYEPDIAYEAEGDALPTYDVQRRVPVRYILVTVESSGIELGKVIDRIEDLPNVLEVEELTK